VNLTIAAHLPTRCLSWWKYATRHLSRQRRSDAFSLTDAGAIGRIEVINLDRAMDRWARLHAELGKHTEATGRRLTSITKRFRATDARDLDPLSIPAHVLIPTYTLAQQFSVDPQYADLVDKDALESVITMTKQEIAIALSHIAVWRSIDTSRRTFTLILEDDVYFARDSARKISRTWNYIDKQNLDLLYLSFQETGTRRHHTKKRPARRPDTGIWHASGYVLSAAGARKLLAALPVIGPVDLWLNMQCDALDVLVADHSHIDQRPGVPSSNSYSVMPVLSKVGGIRREAPQLVRRSHARWPIIVNGSDRSGLASVAAALSVLGYRTAAHMDTIPNAEFKALLHGRRRRVFDAYVDIGFSEHDLKEMRSRGAKLITVNARRELAHCSTPAPDLSLSVDDVPWQQLTGFLNAPYPDEPWPDRVEQPRTHALEARTKKHRNRPDRWDHGPWILRRELAAPLDSRPFFITPDSRLTPAAQSWSHPGRWYGRSDTFPSNRALFRPDNIIQQGEGGLALKLAKSQNSARPLAGAAIASSAKYKFGQFGAELRAAAGSAVLASGQGGGRETEADLLGSRMPRTRLDDP